jgi:hypothetical protein
MSEDNRAQRITIEWADGEVGVFTPTWNGTWVQQIGGLRVTNYDAPNVMLVLSTAVGTKEIAERE